MVAAPALLVRASAVVMVCSAGFLFVRALHARRSLRGSERSSAGLALGFVAPSAVIPFVTIVVLGGMAVFGGPTPDHLKQINPALSAWDAFNAWRWLFLAGTPVGLALLLVSLGVYPGGVPATHVRRGPGTFRTLLSRTRWCAFAGCVLVWTGFGMRLILYGG